MLQKDTLYQALSRESSSGRFIPVIDGLRFVAIMSVILYHLNGFVVTKTGGGHDNPLSSVLREGYFGVPLFFVISGFIISYPFARRLLAYETRLNLKDYYLRRVTRLEPPYILNLILVFAMLVAVAGQSAGELGPHLLASMFYMHNLVFGEISRVNGVAWSLEIECQFYLLAPLLVAVFRIRNTTFRRLLLVSAILCISYTSSRYLSHDVRLKLSVLYYANYFLTGFLLADVYLVSWRENPAPSLGGDLLSVFSWSGVLVLLLSPPAWELLLPPMVFLAYCGAFRGRYSSRFFSHPAIYLIGGMCYTIYLYHFYVISAVGGLVLNVLPAGLPVWGNLIVVGLVVVPAIFLICAVLFVLTEKPFMKRHWHRSVTARLAPSYRAE